MPYNAVVKTEETSFEHIVDASYPPLIKGVTLKADQGIIENGTILARDGDRNYVPYDGAGASPLNIAKAVLLEKVDTTKQTVARTLKLGVVVAKNVKVAGVPATQEQLDALEETNIYS